MDSEVITEIVGSQAWLDPVADNLQKVVRDGYAAGGPPCAAIESFLHGEWLGHPLHSTLTDVPLGAWTVTAAMDVAEAAGAGRSAGQAADAALMVGLIGAAGAAVAGFTDWSTTEGKDRRVGIAHGLLNTTASALYLTSLILRKRKARSAGRALAWLGYGIGSFSAYLGGALVYSSHVGVKEKRAAPRPAIAPAQPRDPMPMR